MNKFPTIISQSSIPFALQGRISSGFELLVISDNCSPALRNAMPRNSAGKFSGRLACSWINLIRRNYNWAYSNALPEMDREILEAGDEDIISFQPGSQLQFAWRSYSDKLWREKVQKRLDRQKLDLCKAIIANDKNAIANAIGPIILACEGYSN